MLAVPGLIIFKHQLASVAVGISCMGLLGEIQDFYPILAVPLNPALSVIVRMADRNCNLLYAINTLSTVVKNTCCGWEINILSFFLSFFLILQLLIKKIKIKFVVVNFFQF